MRILLAISHVRMVFASNQVHGDPERRAAIGTFVNALWGIIYGIPVKRSI